MKTSESIKNLTKALLTAQTKMGAATKGAKNPFFKSSYADLPTVMEVVKDPLNDAGIIVLQPANHDNGRNFITTTLIHAESGEWVSSTTEVICAKQNDPQAFGAAQTYARRFGLQSMLFIPSEDDDGNTASGRNPYATKAATEKATTHTVNTVPPLATKQTVETPAGGVKAEALAAASQAQLTPVKTSSFSKKPKTPPATTTSTPAAFE